MPRQLLLAPRGAAHSFRHTLRTTRREARRQRENSDWRLFVLSFLAFFVCFYSFIA